MPADVTAAQIITPSSSAGSVTFDNQSKLDADWMPWTELGVEYEAGH